MSRAQNAVVVFLASAVALGLPVKTDACTSILVTKGASVDGSTMISYSADAEFHPRPRIIPAADHKPGSKKEIRGWRGVLGHVPEVRHTYKVVGLMNEHQLAIGETTFGGRTELKSNKGIFHYYPLMLIALERAKTAREAITVMTSLVEKYGYISEGESISIADKNEVWLLEIVGPGKNRRGAIWVAVRIPDGMVAAHANMSRIHRFPLNDPDNARYSKNVIKYAIKKGYYNPKSNKPFSFSNAYNPPTHEQVKVAERRVWSIFRRAAPSLKLSPDYSSLLPGSKPYPLFIKPDRKLSVRDVIALHRDHYEGTRFDTTKDHLAGPFGAPDRWRPLKWEAGGKKYSWERPIATQQVGFVYVSQSRADFPDAIGGVNWFGMDNPYTNVFVPFYTSITRFPKSYVTGKLSHFTPESAWWAYNFVANYANLRYSYMIKDIQKVQQEIEDVIFGLQPAVEQAARHLRKTNPEMIGPYLTQYCNSTAEETLQKWWDLADLLITKYNDGYIQNPKGRPQEIGYPKKWLEQELEQGPKRAPIRGEKAQDREL